MAVMFVIKGHLLFRDCFLLCPGMREWQANSWKSRGTQADPSFYQKSIPVTVGIHPPRRTSPHDLITSQGLAFLYYCNCNSISAWVLGKGICLNHNTHGTNILQATCVNSAMPLCERQLKKDDKPLKSRKLDHKVGIPSASLLVF